LTWYFVNKNTLGSRSYSPSYASSGATYNYTQLTGSVATTSEILDGFGAFGGVVITEDQAGAVVIYDATSTTAYSLSEGTRIADFQTAMAEGVYMFNVLVDNGIIFSSEDGFAFSGDWTILYIE
jgi:hypothetical protein